MEEKIKEILLEFDKKHAEWVNAAIMYAEVQEEYEPLSYEREHAWIKKWFEKEINDIIKLLT